MPAIIQGDVKSAFRLEEGARLGKKDEVAAIVVTGGLILLQLLSSLEWPSSRGVTSLLLLAVAYSTYRGGLRSGAISGLLSFLYITYALSEKRFLNYDRMEIERIGGLCLVVPGIIALVYALKLRIAKGELEKSIIAEREERTIAEANREQQHRLLLERQARELEMRIAQRTSELAASVESLERVSASIAHDLRGSLIRIIRFAELISESGDVGISAANAEFLAKIGDNASKMDRLIDDLLSHTSANRDCPSEKECTPIGGSA